MKYKIKHYAYFQGVEKKLGKNLINVGSWDLLRTEDPTGDYSIAMNRADYEKSCSDVKLKNIAKGIIDICRSLNCSKISSVGVGRAALEFNIKEQAPEIYVQCLDYTPKAIEILKKVFPKCDEIRQFDMLTDDWSVTENSIVMLYRVSTELDTGQWKKVFKDIAEAGISKILFIPTENLTLKKAAKEKLIQLRNVLLRRRQVFCGYMYSGETFKSMWENAYQIKMETEIEEMNVYILERIDQNERL